MTAIKFIDQISAGIEEKMRDDIQTQRAVGNNFYVIKVYLWSVG